MLVLQGRINLSDLVAVDVNNDGYGYNFCKGSASLRIYAGNSNGSYSSFVGLNGFVRPTRAIAIGDVDLDGDLDLIEGNDGAQSRYYLNDGNGAYGNGQNLSDVARKTQTMVLADINSDGQPDLIEGNDQSPNRIYWGAIKQKSSLFRRSQNLSEGSLRTRSISVGDVNKDGLPDLIVGNKGDADKVFVNNIDGSVRFKATIGGEYPTVSVVLGDVDGDGDLDVLRGFMVKLLCVILMMVEALAQIARQTKYTIQHRLFWVIWIPTVTLILLRHLRRRNLHINSTEINAT